MKYKVKNIMIYFKFIIKKNSLKKLITIPEFPPLPSEICWFCIVDKNI